MIHIILTHYCNCLIFQAFHETASQDRRRHSAGTREVGPDDGRSCRVFGGLSDHSVTLGAPANRTIEGRVAGDRGAVRGIQIKRKDTMNMGMLYRRGVTWWVKYYRAGKMY